MIVSVLGSAVDYSGSKFQVIDLYKVMDMGTLLYYPKKFKLLQKLEQVYGNIIVVGDIFLDSEVRQSITESGGTSYVMESKFSTAIEEINNPKIDLNKSDVVITELPNFDEFETNRKEVVNMSIEESILRAMKDLGVEPDEPVPEPMKKPVEPVPEPIVEPVTPEPEELSLEDLPDLVEETPQKVVVEDLPSKETKTEIRPQEFDLDVYLKIKDGTIALFIPADFEFDVQDIGGIKYNTMVFRAPDLGNTSLQSLKVENAKKPVIPVVKSEPVDDSDLSELVKTKTSLDRQIKTAREEGNKELVKQLRKQRRTVRKQINLWGDKP